MTREHDLLAAQWWQCWGRHRPRCRTPAGFGPDPGL